MATLSRAFGGARVLIDELTSRLNHAGVALQLKLVDHTSRFDRCDSGVLYFNAADARPTLAIVADTYRRVATHMTTRVPAFTRRLADGLALAEDPGGGDSFRTHRCALVAEGLLRAHEAGATRLPARLKIVKDCFREAGINPARPYQRSLDPDQLVGTVLTAGWAPRGRPKPGTKSRSSPPPLASGNDFAMRPSGTETLATGSGLATIHPEPLATPGRWAQTSTRAPVVSGGSSPISPPRLAAIAHRRSPSERCVTPSRRPPRRPCERRTTRVGDEPGGR